MAHIPFENRTKMSFLVRTGSDYVIYNPLIENGKITALNPSEKMSFPDFLDIIKPELKEWKACNYKSISDIKWLNAKDIAAEQ